MLGGNRYSEIDSEIRAHKLNRINDKKQEVSKRPMKLAISGALIGACLAIPYCSRRHFVTRVSTMGFFVCGGVGVLDRKLTMIELVNEEKEINKNRFRY